MSIFFIHDLANFATIYFFYFKNRWRYNIIEISQFGNEP